MDRRTTRLVRVATRHAPIVPRVAERPVGRRAPRWLVPVAYALAGHAALCAVVAAVVYFFA